jgi:UDP-N-acetylmuramate dehydrogenase
MQLQSNYQLQKLNTFGLPCVAKQFGIVRTEEELFVFLKEYQKSSDKLLILGGGSNLLFTQDFDGIVLKNEIKGIKITNEDEQHIWLEVGAGEIWHDLVLYCVQNNWSGIENLSLIPGTVGAAPIQNIGAYGVEAKNVIEEVRTIHLSSLEKKSYLANECEFGYRDSIFKRELKGQVAISTVLIKLDKNVKVNVSYGAIQKILDNKEISQPTIKDVSDTIIGIRESKLPNPKEIGNAGSFFKNPVISLPLYKELQMKHPSIPGYPIDQETIKVPAGWLIEQAGWKGKVIGEIGVHKNQALVLVNYGDGKGDELQKLAFAIQGDVLAKFSVLITPEVNML